MQGWLLPITPWVLCAVLLAWLRISIIGLNRIKRRQEAIETLAHGQDVSQNVRDRHHAKNQKLQEDHETQSSRDKASGSLLDIF